MALFSKLHWHTMASAVWRFGTDPDLPREAKLGMARELAVKFALDNRNFKACDFLDRCGIQGSDQNRTYTAVQLQLAVHHQNRRTGRENRNTKLTSR
jgi:hypothetical protein